MPEWFSKYYKGLNEKKGFICDELAQDKRDQFLSSIAEEYNYSAKEKQKYYSRISYLKSLGGSIKTLFSGSGT